MRGLAVFLFDLTGTMAQPWLEAGYACLIVDTQHPPGLTNDAQPGDADIADAYGEPLPARCRLWRLNVDLREPFVVPAQLAHLPIVFVAAFPPCDHLAVSGSRWFKGKGLRLLALSIDLFATAAKFCEETGAPYLIENPVSNIKSHWRKADHYFHPYEFTVIEPGDNYTKKTCLWVGNGFVMPPKQRDESLGPPDDRIHKASPGPERANFRSATPMGFAHAVYRANCFESVFSDHSLEAFA